MPPPNMPPPPMGVVPPGAPPPPKPPAEETTLAEVGKSAKDYLDVLMPIAIPKAGEDARPIPRSVQCLEDGTDLFKMFDADMNRFDAKAVKKNYHKMAALVDPAKLGREASEADKARWTKLKQAYAVVMDDQMRAVYRQFCFGIMGSGGTPALGHEEALGKALEMGRDLRKIGEERAIVLHKAAETGWSVQMKDNDGRKMGPDVRKHAYQFNLFEDVSSDDGEDMTLEKERRNMPVEKILEMSPKFADGFLDKIKPILLDSKISKKAAGGAFTMHDDPKVKEFMEENPKAMQKTMRKLRTALKQMNWAMTALIQHKDSPWRGLETKGSMAEHGVNKILDIIKSGIAVGKFGDTHEEEFSKLLDSLHRLYMDIFEKRGQELLRAAIQAELTVVHLLPESGGRLPDGTKVILQELKARADLNGKRGTIKGWDYALQRYTVEIDKEEGSGKRQAIQNPDMLGIDDMDDADEDEDEQRDSMALAIPKKLMLVPKNALVDLAPPARKLEELVKSWNNWRSRPRSVSASQDAEAVAAALGPPLQSMAGHLQEAASAVGAGCAGGRDGIDLIAFEAREALQGARNLAAKLLGEEPQEPPAPPPMNEPQGLALISGQTDEVSQVLKEAAEVAAMALELQKKQEEKEKKRSRSRKRKKKRSTSSSSSSGKKKKKKKD